MSETIKGRGALSNPPGRFDRQSTEAVDDGWYADETPTSIATSVEPDHAKSIITTNDSPDVPFEQSINAYRGCEHGCSYCIHGDTPVLRGNNRTCAIADLRVGDEIYGTVRSGRYLRYTKTRVLDHWSVVKPAYRITLADGTQLVTSGDHRFLTERGWKFVIGMMGTSDFRRPHLTTNNKLMGTGAFATASQKGTDYRRGYLCGLIRGDALIGSYSYVRQGRAHGDQHQFRLALCDSEALERAQEWLMDLGIETQRFQFCAGSASRRPMMAIRTQARMRVEAIRTMIAWPSVAAREWRSGFLAGIFDAEGSYSSGILRIFNTDPEIITWICESLQVFGFGYKVEHRHRTLTKPIDVVRVTGGLREHLRFFHSVEPAITRKMDIAGQAVKGQAELSVSNIERLPGAMRLFDITTGTGDFIANGVVSHNCFARPSHAYMGLSSGLDFETRLFYKENAAQLLEAELARQSYVCKPIALGTNTDPYQPVERRLRVTRSILEVLARCRHPVTIVTKGALVLRDLDLLADLARDGLVNVALSVTTLDAELKRTLEPRAASPQARLRAVRELVGAGVPTGVMVAPVIPVLTDHEMESIVDAAADAGAYWAAYLVLRLPYEVKDLFREWLARHYPDRARHVMSIIQSLRGGRDNDPRFGSRMRGTGPFAQLLHARFELACRRRGLGRGRVLPLQTNHFRPPRKASDQLALDL
jgi:DNA repair photolyase